MSTVTPDPCTYGYTEKDAFDKSSDAMSHNVLWLLSKHIVGVTFFTERVVR